MRYAYDIMMAIATIMLRSFLIRSLWLWFIVPQFSAQPLKLATAIGIVCMGSAVYTWKTASKSEIDEMRGYEDKDKFIVPFTNFMAQSVDLVMVYIFAWLIHCMM